MSRCKKEQNKIIKLKEQIKKLRAKLAVYHGIQRTVSGIKGELLISKISKGTKTLHNAPYDIKTLKGNRIEVKRSQCLPVYYRSETPCFRWNWRYLIRPNRKRKYYDYMVLLGEKDKRHRHNDKDRTPYMYFMLSWNEVKKIIDSHGNISLTSNFETVRSKRSKKLLEYRKSYSELKKIMTKL